MRYTLTAVVLLAVVVATVVSGCGVTLFDGPIRINDDYRQQISRGGKVVAFVEELSNTGSPVYEIEYIVLDVGQSSPKAAMEKQTDNMKASEWVAVSEASQNHMVLHPPEGGILATIQPLENFLKLYLKDGMTYPESRAATAISPKVQGSKASLVLVTLSQNN
jgi:hypothetical protein